MKRITLIAFLALTSQVQVVSADENSLLPSPDELAKFWSIMKCPGASRYEQQRVGNLVVTYIIGYPKAGCCLVWREYFHTMRGAEEDS